MTMLGRTMISSVAAAVLFTAPMAAAHQRNRDETRSATLGRQQVDDEVSFDVSTRCRYDVRITGTLDRVDGEGEPLYRPNLKIRTTLTCPGASRRRPSRASASVAP